MRLLYVCHNDPRLHAGGTEIFARELFHEVKRRAGLEPLFLASTNGLHRPRRPGTAFQTVERSADELLLWAGHYDRLFHGQIDSHGVWPEFAELLRSFRPHVVHFQHFLLLGLEAFYLVRRLLPDARIVVTLHDYYPMCHHDGTMVKAPGRELCYRSSPDACHACFPSIPTTAFRLREINIKHLFGLVDRFVSPSRFLRERYIAWGLDPERIEVVPNGRVLSAPVPARELRPGERRNAFAVFGNVNPLKAPMVAVEAARLLAAGDETDFSLTIHGSHVFQSDEFKNGFLEAVKEARDNVVYRGSYEASQVPELMREVDWVIVPSIWWENAPLTIQEAFHHGRPVICSNIGGMAEHVRDGVDGLQFAVGSPQSLLRVMQRALGEPDLWETLAAGIRPARTIQECADDYLELYARLGAERKAAVASAKPKRATASAKSKGAAASVKGSATKPASSGKPRKRARRAKAVRPSDRPEAGIPAP
jgi:glycosyltransferase involved in cell wall biosynthesis